MTTTEDSGIPAATAENHPAPTIDHPDAPLIALEQERADLQAQANAADGDEEANAIQDKVSQMETAIAQFPAYSPVGIAIKLRRLERTFKDSGGAPWDQQNFDTALDALDHLGDVKLVLWEAEYFRLQARFDTLPDNETGPALDEMNAVLECISLSSANTLPGAVLKIRMLRQAFLHSGATDHWRTQGWGNGLESLERTARAAVSASAPVPTVNRVARGAS